MTNTDNTIIVKAEPITTYHEEEIGKTLYRVTNVHLGRIELQKALEEYTVRKILRGESTATSV